MTAEQIIASYKQGHSIRQIAIDAELSYQKCRKILISAGVYSSPTADRIRDLAAAGLTKEQIAERLKVQPKTVECYLSYTKGIYNSETPSANALRIRRHRDKARVQED